MKDHGRWPLVGRARELAEFTAALGRRPNVQAFLIHGPAGVGKTRLADECLAEAEKVGLTTARAVATRTAAGMPLSALAHLLPPDEIEYGELSSVRLFDHARRAIRDRPGGRLVLLVDDLPALDVASLVLLGQLVVAGLIFVVATVRTGEPVPDAVAPLWSVDSSVRVDLGPLSKGDINIVMETALGGPVAVATLAEVYRVCQGNMLYLHELVLGAMNDGALVVDGGVWRLTRRFDGTPRLVELVTQRISDVSVQERAVLERLALCQPIGLDELLDVADVDVLDRLESRGLTEVMVDGRRHGVSLTHPLHGQAIRAGLSRTRHRVLLLDQSARVEARGLRRREDPLRVAAWRLAATGTAEPQLLLRAAQLARYGHDFARVEEFARAALAVAPSAEAAVLLGEALTERGRFAEAEEVLRAAWDLPASPKVMLRHALARGANLFWGLLAPDAAFEVLDAGAQRLEQPLPAEISAMRAVILAFSDRSALALAELDQSQPATEVTMTPLRSLAMAAALAVSGRTREAVEVAEAGQAALLADPTQFTFLHPSIQSLNRSIALFEAGRVDDAVHTLTRALDEVVADDVAHAMSMYLWYLGRQALTQGRPRTAARWCRDAVSLSRTRGFGPSLKIGLAVLAVALAHIGDADGSSAAATEMDTLFGPVDAHGAVPQARAWRAVAAGDLATARDELLTGADAVESLGQHTIAATLLHDVSRLGYAKLVSSRLTDLAQRCDSPFVAARAGYAHAAASGDASAMAAVSDQFARMGATLFAAEAASVAASLWRACGEPRRAAASSAQARALSESCEGARTPALGTTTSVALLTAREREICLLAVNGATSQEIAARLYLSVRTVNNHLQSSYVKLGVTSRRELAERLNPPE